MQAVLRIKRAERPRIGLQRLPLVVQVLLWGMIALGIFSVVSSVSAWLLVNDQAHQMMGRQTQHVLDSFEFELSQDADALVPVARWLASQDNGALFKEPLNTPAALSPLEMLLRMENLDYVLVTDKYGQVLAKTGKAGAIQTGDDVSAFPDIAQALTGQMNTRAQVDGSGQLAIRLALPGYAQTENLLVGSLLDAPIGVISLGFYVDDDYMHRLSSNFSSDIGLVVVSRDHLDGGRLAARAGTVRIAGGETDQLSLNEPARQSDRLLTLETDRGPYLFAFRPLSSVSPTDSILVGSGMSAAVLDRERDKWLRTFGLWLLVGLADLAGVGLLMSRSFGRPLSELKRSVQQIGNGALTNPAATRRPDGFGDLTLHIEEVREDLDQKVKELTFEKNRATAAVLAMAVPVVITDSQNRIAMANRAAQALLGSSSDELAGRVWNALFALPKASDSESLPTRPPAGQVIGEYYPMVVRARLAQDSELQTILDISSMPLHVEGELVGYVHTLQDVSEIDQFTKAKNEFLLSVAHELAGPLASWRASVELLIEDYGEMTRRELGMMLRTLQKTTVRFQTLVEALVDMGKLEAGKFRIQPAPTDFGDMIKAALSQIEPALRARGQDLEVKLGTPPNSRVMADRSRISQVVINLLRNAGKYSPEGEPIIIETSAADGQLVFKVIDRGNGIDPEEQAHIFERYYRSKRVEEDGAGIGLGLALAKAIIEAHGGQIGVSSELGKGSTFWFSLTAICDGHGQSELKGAHESLGGG